MSIKKQVIVFSVVYQEEDTYAECAAEAISHRLCNEDGILDWNFKIKSEEELSASITEEDMED